MWDKLSTECTGAPSDPAGVETTWTKSNIKWESRGRLTSFVLLSAFHFPSGIQTWQHDRSSQMLNLVKVVPVDNQHFVDLKTSYINSGRLYSHSPVLQTLSCQMRTSKLQRVSLQHPLSEVSEPLPWDITRLLQPALSSFEKWKCAQ